MLKVLKSLLDNPDREARRLNRDAPAIIESATRSFPSQRVRDIALATLEHLGEAHEHLSNHGEARRRMDQVALTAYTLVIIHLRAEALDDRAAPALEAIDAFTGQWSHAATP